MKKFNHQKSSYLSRFRRKADLQAQLLISHFLAMALGTLPVFVFIRLYKNGVWDILEAVLAAICSVVVMSLSTGSLIVKPVKELEKAIKSFESTGLVSQVDVATVPELHRLSLAFNFLAQNPGKAKQRWRILTAALMHEIRTPVTVLRNDLERLQQSKLQPSPEVYEKLLRQTTSLTQLAENMLMLSKGESGQLPINRCSFSIQSLLQEVESELAPELRKSSCQVQINCSRNLPNVFSDSDWIKQILINLISNAIRYTPEGEVRVRAWTNDDYLWIAVADTGIGIAGDEQDHIFEPFWRSDHARRLTPRGSGVGLTVVQQLVRLQGGQINVKSELEKGSTFRFSIPLT